MSDGGKNVTALELLTNKFDRIEPVATNYWGYVFGGGVGGVGSVVANLLTRRPLFSGLHRQILTVVVGALACGQIAAWRKDYYAERDAVFRHYVSLHPEDFIMPERKKFGEILLPWTPVR